MQNQVLHIRLFITAFFLLLSFFASAQTVHEPAFDHKEWTAPYPPFRVAGNLYYVGTYDLACFLIATSKGHILINTGTASSASIIKSNIRTLGFKPADIKILLTTQAHYDHVGAMAALQKETGATLMADEADADVLSSGGSTDYEWGGKDALFEPVKPGRLLHNEDTICLGGSCLTLLHHPGHTKGSCSYLLNVKDSSTTYRVLIANLPSIITDRRFSDVKKYPHIAADYAYTFKAMREISFDLWLSSHASQFGLHTKHHPGDAYNPNAFRDPNGYTAALSDLEKEYKEKLKKDK